LIWGEKKREPSPAKRSRSKNIAFDDKFSRGAWVSALKDNPQSHLRTALSLILGG
jgi:hypothetical protein